MYCRYLLHKSGVNFFHQRSKFSLKRSSSLEIQTRSWNKWPVELFNMYSLLYTNSSFPGNERCDLHRVVSKCTSIFAYLTRTWPFLSYLTNLVLVHSIWSSSSFLKRQKLLKISYYASHIHNVSKRNNHEHVGMKKL